MATNATASAKECGVCNEEFDEEVRCPRIFQCFHTLCTSCIDQLIINNRKQCPFCRRNFMAKGSNDINVNYTTLQLMKYIAFQEQSSKPVQKDRVPPLDKRIEDLKRETQEISSLNLVNCQEAEKQIEKFIKEVINLQKNIHEENTRIESNVLPNIQNVIYQNSRTVEELDRTKNKFENQLRAAKDKSKQLDNAKEKIDSCTANAFRDVAVVVNDAKGINSAVGGWFEDFNKLVSEEKEALQTTEKEVKRTKEKIKSILEVLSSEDEGYEEEFQPIPGMAAMEEEEDIEEDNLPLQMTSETLREMNAQVKHLVEQGRIYALQEHEGRRRCARISITGDEKLCLHHLTEEPLPSNVHFIHHRDVMRLVDPSSRLTFLELGVDGKSTALGRLYIRLSQDTKRAQQFSVLCTGEMGPSYAHTNILEAGSKGQAYEYVNGGDYEKNNGGGGKALLEGVREETGGEYQRPWLAGTVKGMWWSWGDAQFLINTRDNPGKMLDASFGMVEEGLSVLTEAISHYPNIRDVSIKDCGIVLPF